MIGRTFPKILPAKEKTRAKRKRSPAFFVVLAALMLSQVAALATTNQPKLVETYPDVGVSVQSQHAQQITATYDRGLDVMRSEFRLEDHTGMPVDGTTSFMRAPTDSDDLKVIVFAPHAALTEAGSPYTGFAYACPATPGDCAQDSWPFQIDDTAPAPPAISQPSNGDIRNEQTVDVRGTAEPGSRVVVIESEAQIASGPALQNGDFSIQLPYGDEDGVHHTIALHAIDQAGNVGDPSPSISFVHDDVTVTPFITTPLEGAQLNSTSVGIAGTAKASTTIYVYEGSSLVGTETADAQGHWIGSLTFAEGAHAVTVYSFDGSTLDGPSNTRDFVVDTTPPGAPAISVPSAGAMVGTQDVTVSGTAEPLSTVTVRESVQGVVGTGTTSSAGAWSAMVHLTDGTHTITATAKDRAGNAGPVSAARSFTVDTVAPAAPVFTSPQPGAQLNTSNVAIAGRAEALSTVRIIEHATVIATATTSGAGTFSTTISLQDGQHSLTGVAVDGAGNAGPGSEAVTFTVDTIAPGQPIIYSPPEDGQYTTNDVFVAGSAEPNCRIAIYEGTTLLGKTASDRNGDWAVTLKFSNGPHTISVQAIDLAGNIGPMTDGRNFLVGAISDTTPPPAPIIEKPEQNSLQPSFVKFQGSAEPNSTVKIYKSGVLIVSGTTDDGGGFDLGTTMDPGTASVVASATDQAGNVSVYSDVRTFKVDSTRPTITIDTADLSIFIPITNILITGTASDDYGVAHVELDYVNKVTSHTDLTEDAETCSGCPNAPVTWQASPASLGPGIYDVNAYAVDLVGNRSNPATITIIVV